MNHRSNVFDGTVRILFSTRVVRMFAYGFLSVILVLCLSSAGLSDGRIGLLLTATLIGDTVVSLLITLFADRVGRRAMLMVGRPRGDRQKFRPFPIAVRAQRHLWVAG